jgi:hypothetical protein
LIRDKNQDCFCRLRQPTAAGCQLFEAAISVGRHFLEQLSGKQNRLTARQR